MAEFYTDLGLNRWKVSHATGLRSFHLSHFQSFRSFTPSVLQWLLACGNKWNMRQKKYCAKVKPELMENKLLPFHISDCLYCSRSFPPTPVQHVRSAVVPTNRRHQSHWLRKHSLPISPLLWRQLLGLVSQIYSSMCSASKDVYLYTVATHTHTCTYTKLRWILLSLFLEPKRSPTEFLTLFFFF